jgi:hypothetical protein
MAREVEGIARRGRRPARGGDMETDGARRARIDNLLRSLEASR